MCLLYTLKDLYRVLHLSHHGCPHLLHLLSNLHQKKDGWILQYTHNLFQLLIFQNCHLELPDAQGATSSKVSLCVMCCLLNLKAKMESVNSLSWCRSSVCLQSPWSKRWVDKESSCQDWGDGKSASRFACSAWGYISRHETNSCWAWPSPGAQQFFSSWSDQVNLRFVSWLNYAIVQIRVAIL